MVIQRHIGIDLVPASPWGTHFCLFYRTQQDLLDILVPYFKAGLEANEFCMWVTSEPLCANEARSALGRAVRDLSAYESRKQIEILDYTEWYTLTGHFDADRVLAGWVEKERDARQHGFDGLRLTGNTFWLEEADWHAFIEYEAAVDSVISQYHMIALCTYSLDKCGASEVIDVTNQHQFALAKRGSTWQMIESASRRAAALEVRVAERTRELQALNAQLRQENAERQKHAQELGTLNRALKARNESSQALMRAAEEQAYLEQVCRIVVEDCGHAMVWIGFAEDNEDKSVRPVASAGFEKGYLETLKITWADSERGRGPTGTAIRTGKPDGCANMLTDPKFTPWRAEALQRGYASSLALPLRADGKTLGALTIYAREPEAFSGDEITLLSELGDDLAYGITMLRLRAAHAQAEAALRQSEARYRSLFESMNEGFALHEILCDAEGKPVDYRFLELNPAFERLTGLKREDVAGQTARAVLPQLEDYWVDTYGRVALTGEPVHFENYAGPLQQHYEVFAYRPAPGQFAVLFVNITDRKQAEDRIRALNQSLEQQAEALRVANLNLEASLAQEQSARADAEARKRELEQVEVEIQGLNRDLAHRNTELESANRELESFSYSISHDLRTPLGSIENFAKLVLQDHTGEFSPEAQLYLGLIRDNSAAMTRLVQGLLSFSRTLRQPLRKETVDPHQQVSQVLEELRSQQAGRQVEIVLGELPPCQADPVLLKQVWVNLLSNALKFTRRCDPARIEIASTTSPAGEMCYLVRDNGVGFSPENAERLFGVFQRLHSEDEYEGTGVGLAIVQRIVARHGGRIWAESAVGQGATFWFTLG